MLDVTSYWVFLQRNRQFLGLILAGLLLFLSGWQLGRVTSPYYNSSEIIFQDRQCTGDDCASSGGSLTELDAVQAESAGLGTPGGTQAIAGVTQGAYVASVNSDLYHHVSCPTVSRINEENKVWFASPTEVENAGYAPSACAREKAAE